MEGLSSNFFAIQDGALLTADEGVLSGTIREIVLEVRRSYERRDLYTKDEPHVRGSPSRARARAGPRGPHLRVRARATSARASARWLTARAPAPRPPRCAASWACPSACSRPACPR